MKLFWRVMNFLCILGLVFSLISAAFVIGKPQFADRFFLVVLFQIPCLGFMLARGINSGRKPK